MWCGVVYEEREDCEIADAFCKGALRLALALLRSRCAKEAGHNSMDSRRRSGSGRLVDWPALAASRRGIDSRALRTPRPRYY